MDLDLLFVQVQAGDRRALARALSLIEDQAPGADDLHARLYPHSGGAWRLGITGPPGAGKSTLAAALAQRARADGERVAILAVDPSSPVTGGAFLGDRIRMQALGTDPGVFVRSMAGRGASGGLAEQTERCADLLDAAGFPVVIIETVGVGQSEAAIAALADTTLLVLHPETGDAVQGLKAGLLELADLLVCNKADLPGATRTVAMLAETAALRMPGAAAGPDAAPVLAVSAERGDGLDELWARLTAIRAAASAGGARECRRRAQARARLARAVEALIARRLVADPARRARYEAEVDAVARRATAPDAAARALLADLGIASEPPAR